MEKSGVKFEKSVKKVKKTGFRKFLKTPLPYQRLIKNALCANSCLRTEAQIDPHDTKPFREFRA